jgi:ABC-2 type transport system permease protein
VIQTLLPPALTGALTYEFKMAARRKVLWLSVLPLLALSAFLVLTSPRPAGLPVMGKMAVWGVIINMITTLGLGVALADRFTTRGAGLNDLLKATPTSVTARMLGTLTGSLAAALTPAATVMVLAGVGVGISSGDPVALLWAVVAFLTIILPGALMLTTFSATAGLLLPVPVARVLAVAAWFWATIFNTSLVPVLSPTGTVLSPLGDYVAAGWLSGPVLWAGRGHSAVLSPPVSGASAGLNFCFVLVIAAVLFTVARLVTAAKH